jgi:hypothetical protein
MFTGQSPQYRLQPVYVPQPLQVSLQGGGQSPQAWQPQQVSQEEVQTQLQDPVSQVNPAGQAPWQTGGGVGQKTFPGGIVYDCVQGSMSAQYPLGSQPG